MLNLDLKCGNAILITAPDGQRIIVRHVGFHRAGRVKLSVEAPRNFTIVRGDLLTGCRNCGHKVFTVAFRPNEFGMHLPAVRVVACQHCQGALTELELAGMRQARPGETLADALEEEIGGKRSEARGQRPEARD